MSISKDDVQKVHADAYHKELKRLQEKNVENEKIMERYNSQDGPKPDIKFMGENSSVPLSQEEMHEQSKNHADRIVEGFLKAEKAGLIRENRSDIEKEKEMGHDKKIKKEEQRLEHERQEQEKKRNQSDGRSM